MEYWIQVYSAKDSYNANQVLNHKSKIKYENDKQYPMIFRFGNIDDAWSADKLLMDNNVQISNKNFSSYVHQPQKPYRTFNY